MQHQRIEACEYIAGRIGLEQQADELRRACMDEGRKRELTALRQRHEKNYQLELRSGIRKPLYCRSGATTPSPFQLGFNDSEHSYAADSQIISKLKQSKNV